LPAMAAAPWGTAAAGTLGEAALEHELASFRNRTVAPGELHHPVGPRQPGRFRGNVRAEQVPRAACSARTSRQQSRARSKLRMHSRRRWVAAFRCADRVAISWARSSLSFMKKRDICIEPNAGPDFTGNSSASGEDLIITDRGRPLSPRTSRCSLRLLPSTCPTPCPCRVHGHPESDFPVLYGKVSQQSPDEPTGMSARQSSSRGGRRGGTRKREPV